MVVVLAFLVVAAVTSVLAAGSLAALEVAPEAREKTVRRIRVSSTIVGFSLAGGLGGFTYNFIAAMFK